jgi:putative membrane protein
MVAVIALISTCFIVLSAILMAFGWYFVRKGNMAAHKKFMVAASVCVFCFFILYMSRTALIGNMTFGGPTQWKWAYLSYLAFHILLATSGGILVLVSLFLGWKGKIAFHKKVGPWTTNIWFATAATGVLLYLVLYVIFPGVTTASMLKAMLHK